MKKLYGIVLIAYAATGQISGLGQFQKQDTLNRSSLIKVDPFRLNIISPSSGVQFYRNGIVFLSNSRNEDKMLQNHISFGKAIPYYVAYNDTIPGNHTAFSPSESFEVPCDAMTFNSDYSVMYYTKKPSGRSPEKIYRAVYESSKGGSQDWISDPEPISICDDNSVYSHPSLSADGEMMVFASNRKESTGGFDIFITRRKGETWSDPENAGSSVNTPGDEFSPYLDKDNNLYFSSDGRSGSGGLDIYLCSYNGSGWDNPVNLTDKINTDNDETAFTVDRSDGQSAFFSRKMKSGKGSIRLFRIVFRDKVAANQLISLTNAFNYIAMGELPKPGPATPVSTASVKELPVKTEPVATQVKTQQAEPARKELGAVKEPQPPATSDAVVYRVQFASNSKPKGSYEITVNGTRYRTFEYLFNGAYRSCAGEFNSPGEATGLQKGLKQTGYKDAFVVAFKNNVRLLEPVKSGQVQVPVKPKAEVVQAQKQAEPQQDASKTPSNQPLADKNAVIYRVQFASNQKPRGSFEMSVRGNKYKTFEYLYNGAYRSCVGEFNTRTQAIILQEALKLEGFKDAFVVAFRNNVRSLDPALFR